MALDIETFSAGSGGNIAYKALAHPLVGEPAQALIARLRSGGPVAVYDPAGLAGTFHALHPLTEVLIGAAFVQDVARMGKPTLGQPARPVTDPALAEFTTVFIPAFDAGRQIAQIRHLLHPDADVITLDGLKIPNTLLTRAETYLSPLNFATNFAFFRDGDGQHTRLVTADYWSGYGAPPPRLWCRLFGELGDVLAEWEEAVASLGAGIVIDSAVVRQRHHLPAFTGQLFIHVVGAAGHDVVKYALDTYGDDGAVLSCTHDANAWPADHYAGLPAPAAGERVILWVQNSHPVAIPAGAITLNPMGREDQAIPVAHAIPPFATLGVEVGEVLPALSWPAQVEITAAKHFVRPRYEVVSVAGRRRIAHPNVERGDLRPDPAIAELSRHMGKGFILAAPILPLDRFTLTALPTPMSRACSALPLAALVYDADGREVARKSLGRLPRDHRMAVTVADVLGGRDLPGGTGHLELIYDTQSDPKGVAQAADGWLHALFRVTDRVSGHAAETSFGSHIFNTCLTWKNEPQSYTGRPPGLSTRLFLRLGPPGVESLCHLIYPASTPWHARSETRFILMRGDGVKLTEVARAIACSGSLSTTASALFGADALRDAGPGGYVVIRDTTCRLFGYHGLRIDGADGAFSLDHMFGF